MQIIGTRTIDGPNVFTHRPIVLMTLDLEDLHERESCDLPGFVDRLVERVPGLSEHVCAKGHPGAFVERLREGTYLGHVVEHVAIEWGHATGATGNYGKPCDRPGRIALTWWSPRACTRPRVICFTRRWPSLMRPCAARRSTHLA